MNTLPMKAQEAFALLSKSQQDFSWCGDQTVQEVWQTSNFGTQLLTLYQELCYSETRPLLELTFAKALCANTARHFMSKASLVMINTALRYSKGRASNAELTASHREWVLDQYREQPANEAAYAAARTWAPAADAAGFSSLALYQNSGDYRLMEENGKVTANICRKHLHPDFKAIEDKARSKRRFLVPNGIVRIAKM